MQRAQRKEAAAEGSAATQIPDLAFNLSGHGMRLPHNYKQQTLVAFDVNTKAYEQARKQAENDDEDVDRPELGLTQRERGEPQVGESRYIIVGFVPKVTAHKKNELKKVVGPKQGAAVGTVRPETSQLVNHKGAYIAVVKIQEMKPTDGVKYWLLIKPKGGLCVPHTVAQNEVFFLSQFRTNVGNLKARSTEWSRQVLKAMEKLRDVEDEPTAKQLLYRRAYDTTKIVYNPKKSVLNELLLYAALHEKTHDGSYLAEMTALLEDIKPDLAAKPRLYSQLRTFADGAKTDIGIDGDDYESLAMEVEERWPMIQDVSPTNLQLLHQGLLDQGMSIPYRSLRPFLAEGCYRAGKTEQDPGQLVADVLANVERVMGPEPTAPMTDTEQTTILRAMIEKLKESVQAGRRFEKELGEMAGDVGETSLVDIWSNYANSVDVDSAKKAFFEVVRVFAAEQQTKCKGLLAVNEEMVEILSGLNLG